MVTTTPSSAAADYTSSSIKIKKGIEHVRARPAMYIGDVHERGLHHLVNEVVDNSVDEAMAGHCTEITVTLQTDGAISILDNGRGIPVGIHETEGKPTLEVCLTVLGAGGKFDKDSYKVSGGLHGVGVSCVNALSEWLEAEVYREGKAHRIAFEQGKTVRELKVVGPSSRRGTKITFLPDPTIFRHGITFKRELIAKRLKELAYLNAGLKISLHDERDEQHEEYCFPNGLKDFVQDLSTSEDALLDEPVFLKGNLESSESGGVVEVEAAIQYNDTYNDVIVSYTNNIATIEGGTHLTGFRTALTSTLNAWLKLNESQFKLKKDADRPSGDDYREGLVAVVSVKVPEPQFEGQTKTKLGNSDVAGIVQQVVGEYLRNWWEQNPKATKTIISKALQARKARLAAKKAKELVRKAKDALRGGGVAKLKDCESTKPEECELYLVEGDSAGGTATRARDTRTQAILPLRGKILNVWKSTHDRMLSNNEIATMIKVLGTGILDEFDISKLNYHKIIIMCDADVDGSHIRTLILTFFFRQMQELIAQGHVYVAQPPLFKTRLKGHKKETYHLTQEDFDDSLLELGLEGTVLRRTGAGAEGEIGGETLLELVELLSEVGRLGKELEKKQIELGKYLARANAEGQLPFARLYFRGQKRAPAFYSDDELEAFLEQARAKQPDLKVWEHSDPLSERAEADVEVVRFSSKRRLEAIQKRLAGLGLSWDDHARPVRELGAERDPEPFFGLWRKKKLKGSNEEPYVHVLPVAGLVDLPTQVRGVGLQNLADVQRYKGLGEMDADELEETTMDPHTRRLLRVTLDDVANATRLFSVLMGNKVEPRREFIAAHAREVRDLDV